MRKNFIIATAGHVDHGKTSIIKALTGKDCDTHPEEKKRGITIHLGFSFIQLSEDIFAGIVDVPGHKDFIDNMISGINGIDLVLFVIAADEGFMPQTAEHLQILDMLGLKKGIIVLTKCDLVGKEEYFLVKEEIKAKMKNTFLENAPIFGTSMFSPPSPPFLQSHNPYRDIQGRTDYLHTSGGGEGKKNNIHKLKPLLLKMLLSPKKNRYYISSITSTGNAGILPANKTEKSMHAGKMPAFPVEVTALMVRPSDRGGSPKKSVCMERIYPFPNTIIKAFPPLSATPNPLSHPFRLYPDRFFHIKGFGSVLTGTVLSGQLDKKSNLFTVPSDKEFKIRKLESYGRETAQISEGQRASLNIANFDKTDFEKGMMLCSESYSLTALIDVELRLFEDVSQLEQWSTVEFYTATIHTQAKLHLIDKEKLRAGDKCFVQVHLNKAIAVCFGDKFIIRNSSGISTLGGGVILDAFPLHHRRRTEKVKELFKLRLSRSLKDLICSEIEKSVRPISIEQISKKLFKTLQSDILYELPEKYIQYNNYFWQRKQQDRLEHRIITYLEVAHKKNPLENIGKTPEEFLSLVQDLPENARLLSIQTVLTLLFQKGIVAKNKNTYSLSSHKIQLDSKDHDQIYWVDMFILNQKMQVPLKSELTSRGLTRGINENRMKQILSYLIGKKRIIQHDGEYLHTLVVNPARKKLLENLSQNPEGISVAEFRDMINGNRKICVLMLNIFDNEGIIKRVGDRRFITEKGIALITSSLPK